MRVRLVDDRPPRASASYVLYWMIAARRTRASFALQRAREWAQALRLPLLVLEPLRAGYRWAADRHHAFVIQGMHDQAARLGALGVRYLPYVEPEPGAGQGLLAALAERAALVVTDDSPMFFLPRMIAAAGRRLGCRLEAIDGNGLLPLAATDRVFTRAHSFRAFLQKTLPEHLERLERLAVLASLGELLDQAALPLERAPIDLLVPPAGLGEEPVQRPGGPALRDGFGVPPAGGGVSDLPGSCHVETPVLKKAAEHRRARARVQSRCSNARVSESPILVSSRNG